MGGRRNEFVKLAVYFFLLTGTFGFLQPFQPLYMEAAGLNRGQIGLILGLGAGLALIVQPLIGRLTDWTDSRRPAIVACSLTAFAAFSLYPFARGQAAFMILTAVGANGVLFLNSAGAILAGRMAQEGSGGASYAEVRLWGSIGYIATTLLSGLLVAQKGGGVTRASLDPIFQGGSWLFLAVTVMAFLLPDPKSGPRPDEGRKLEKAPLPSSLKWFLAAYFLYFFALYGASGFLSIYLKALGARGVAITAVFAAGVVVEVLVMRWVGQFSDRFGRRPALAIAFLILPGRLLLYTLPWGAGWVAAVQSLHGFNFGIMGALSIVMANDLSGHATRGQAQARISATGGLANALSPMVFGLIAAGPGMAWMFAAASVVALGGAFLFITRVEDSLPHSESLADRFPPVLRGLASWLDAPRSGREHAAPPVE